MIAHRLWRESMVAQALVDAASASVDALVAEVYRGIGPQLQRFARLSLLAHLIKLEREGRARHDGDTWHAC